jgi:UPF0148 protein
MADWLRKGATMLSESCPVCVSPLFKIGNEVWCPKCNKRVVIVKEEEEIEEVTRPLLLSNIEKVLLTKVQDAVNQMKDEKDYEKLYQLSKVLVMWLEALERVEHIKKEKVPRG